METLLIINLWCSARKNTIRAMTWFQIICKCYQSWNCLLEANTLIKLFELLLCESKLRSLKIEFHILHSINQVSIFAVQAFNKVLSIPLLIDHRQTNEIRFSSYLLRKNKKIALWDSELFCALLIFKLLINSSIRRSVPQNVMWHKTKWKHVLNLFIPG